MENLKNVLLLVLLVVINGVFSMTETAVVSVRKTRLQSEADNGNTKAKTALQLVENPNAFFSTIQIVISLISIISGAYGAALFSGPVAAQLRKVPFLASAADNLAVILVSVVITYFSLVIGELVPKRLAISEPEKIASQMSGTMKVISAISMPLVKFLSFSTDVVLKLIGAKGTADHSVSEEEVKVMIEQGKQVGVFEETEQDIVESVFRMSDRTVDALMTPRIEVPWLDVDEPIDENLNEIMTSDNLYYPLIQGQADNVIGIVSSKKLLDSFIRHETTNLMALADKPLFIPESKSALSVVDMLRDAGKQVAIVLDEYGGFSGMVTLMDIMESLVGDVPNSIGFTENPVVQRADGSYLLDGQLDIDETKRTLDIKELEDEDRIGYQTLGGFILSQFGFIPNVGDSFEKNGYHFEVVDMDNRRIDKVMVRKVDDEAADENEKPVAASAQKSSVREQMP